jgi:hypothetical protein
LWGGEDDEGNMEVVVDLVLSCTGNEWNRTICGSNNVNGDRAEDIPTIGEDSREFEGDGIWEISCV